MIVSAFMVATGGAGTSWSAIVLALLGSSAVGAIVGGYITTRLRGDIERDEAWRTRLVDCADSFLAQLGRTVGAIPHSWLAAVEASDEDIRVDGRLSRVASQAINSFEQEKKELLPLTSRLELLFGADAGVPAREAVRIVVNAGDVFAGAAWVRYGVAQFGARGLGIDVEGAVDLDPEEFDPDDDESVALWTRMLLESVGRHERDVFRACTTQIRSRHPSQGAR